MRPTFECSQAFLERQPGGILCARIFVALAWFSDSILFIGRGLVDRGHHRAIIWIGLLPGVDGKCFEFHLSSC